MTLKDNPHVTSATNLSYFRGKLISLLRFRGEIVWVFIGQLILFSGWFIGVKALTNLMGPERYGQLALGLTISGTLNMCVYGPIGHSVLRFYSIYSERNSLNEYFYFLKKVHKYAALVTLCLIGLTGIIINLIFGSQWALLIVVALFFGIVSGFNTTFLSLQMALRKRKIVSLHQGLDAWLRPALAVALISLFSNIGYIALLGFMFGATLVTLSQIYFSLRIEEIKNNMGFTPNKERIRAVTQEFSRFSAPLVLLAVFAVVSMYSDRWILQALFDTKEVGIYAAIYQIANGPIVFIFGIIQQFIVPIIFEHAAEINSEKKNRVADKLLIQTLFIAVLLMVILLIMLFFCGDKLLMILTNRDFAKHPYLLWLITLGISLFNIGQLISVKGFYLNRTGVYLNSKVLHSVSFIILVFLFGRRYGVYGIVVSSCISSLFYLGGILFVNRRLNSEYNL